MRLKILSIDCDIGRGDERIDNFSFYNSPSFTDYDVLIIDPLKISKQWEENRNLTGDGDGSIWAYSYSDGGFSKKLKEIMNQRAKESELLLERTGGIVICFLRYRGEILNCAPSAYNKEKRSIIHSYSWIPTKKFLYSYKDKRPNGVETLQGTYMLSPDAFNPFPRLGKEIGEIDKSHPFSQYFIALRDEIRFEVVLSDPSGLLNVFKPIARNKVGEVIALEILFGKGKFIFLPPPFPRVAPKATGVLIDYIRKSLQWTQPLSNPDWVKDYRLPGEEPLLDEMNKVDKELREVTRKKEGIQKKVNELELLKGLLYESGKYGLEPAVRKAFSLLGFNVLEPEEYDKPYDLFAKEGELHILGEIEGSKNQIDVDKYRQLLDYVTEATLEGKKCKGILIGNGYVDIEPSKREEQFTDQVIRGCDSQKYCRVTTTELYKAVNVVLSEPQNHELKNFIKEKILECESEFRLERLEH